VLASLLDELAGMKGSSGLLHPVVPGEHAWTFDARSVLSLTRGGCVSAASTSDGLGP
jgi:hypothetical protein